MKAGEYILWGTRGARKDMLSMDIKNAVIKKVQTVDNIDTLWLIYDFLCNLLRGAEKTKKLKGRYKK